MPTARHSSSSSALWPAYYPPALRSLSDPRPHPEPAKLPPSVRYRTRNYHRTLQDDLDDLDNDEDNHYNQVYDLRQYGHSWLVPLGRQRTHDEEVDSQYHSSPNHHPTDGDLSFSPPLHPIDGGGGGGGGPQVEYYDGVLNLDELARRPGPLRIPPRDDDDDDGGEGVVDLDAEIEDADATDLDSDDDDDDHERSHAAAAGEDDDGDGEGGGGGTPIRRRRPPATHDSDDDDESMDA